MVTFDGTSGRDEWLMLAIAACIGLASGSCGPDIEQESPPDEQVTPVFDSEAGTIPLPNDAALDDQGTLPDQEGFQQENAQGVFYRWLSTLHGWLPSQAIEIPFDAPLDTSTLTPGETVRLYEKTPDGWKTRAIDSVKHKKGEIAVTRDGEETKIDGARLVVQPKEALESRSEYAVVATKGLKGADGEPVLEPRAIFFAASQEPLVDDDGNKTIDSIPNDRTAQDLEALRKLLQPVFERAKQDGIDRDQVATAFRWTTRKDPQTVLDPETSTIPLPNDAAMETRLEIPKEQRDPWDTEEPTLPELEHVGEGTAQAHFEEYLDRLHGWLTSTTIELPVDGTLDPSTVTTDNFQLWTQPEEGEPARVELEKVTWKEEASKVVLTPKEPLQRRTRYAAFATADVENEEGQSLKLPAALQMAAQPHPVLKDGSPTVDELSDEQAEQIAGLREFVRPAAEMINEQAGESPEDLGAIWTWHTVQDTLAVFDPQGGVFGFPNEFARQTPEGRVSLSTEGLSDTEKKIFRELNGRRGFSRTASGWIPFAGPVDPSTITKGKSVLIRARSTLADPSALQFGLDYLSSSGHITFTPTQPFPRDTKRTDPGPETTASPLLAVATTTALKSPNGWPVRPTPFFVFLRSPEPLIDDEGNITVGPLRDQVQSAENKEDAREAIESLEANRKSFDTLLQIAPELSDAIDSRHGINTAFAFHPENSTQTAQELRARAIDRIGYGTGFDVRETSGDGDAPNVQMDNVAESIWYAEFDTIEYVEPETGKMRTPGQAPKGTADISVFLPETNGDCSKPFDVAIVQHGLGGDRFGPAGGLVDALAEQCIAAVTMDFPLHGDRAPSDGESGDGFLSQDVVRSKNNVLQSVVDLVVLTRLIRKLELEKLTNDDAQTFKTGSSTIGYVGNSLGAFVGAPFVALESGVQAAALSGVGARYTDVLENGDLGGSLIDNLRDTLDLDEDSFGYVRTLSFVQWVAEPIEPLVFAPYLEGTDATLETLAYESGSFEARELDDAEVENDVLLQMARGDGTVPNSTTLRLAETLWSGSSETGTALCKNQNAFQAFDASHGFVTGGSGSAADLARRQAADWLRRSIDAHAGSGSPEEPEVPDDLEADDANCETP